VAAPSANKFGNVSPTTAQHVRDEFGADDPRRIAAVLATAAQSEVGIESTIVDLSRLATHGPVLLRPGHISAQQIAAVIDRQPAAPDAAAPRASGTLESHYAPHTPVAMQDTRSCWPPWRACTGRPQGRADPLFARCRPSRSSCAAGHAGRLRLRAVRRPARDGRQPAPT
jgi:hypothetical protein